MTTDIFAEAFQGLMGEEGAVSVERAQIRIGQQEESRGLADRAAELMIYESMCLFEAFAAETYEEKNQLANEIAAYGKMISTWARLGEPDLRDRAQDILKDVVVLSNAGFFEDKKAMNSKSSASA